MNEKSHIIAKVYGYLVCLVSVIVILVTISSLIGAFFDMSDPLHTNNYGNYGPMGVRTELSSFEAYKISKLSNQTTSKDSQSTYTPDDVTLRASYESEKANTIDSVRQQAQRTITVDIILLLVAVLLFWRHWIWVSEKK